MCRRVRADPPRATTRPFRASARRAGSCSCGCRKPLAPVVLTKTLPGCNHKVHYFCYVRLREDSAAQKRPFLCPVPGCPLNDRDAEPECAICMEALGLKYDTLLCGHQLHKYCFEQLQATSATPVLCPLCREEAHAIAPFPDPLLEASSDSEEELENEISHLKRSGLMLEFAPSWVKANRFAVLAAVRQNGLSLEFAAPRLQADRAVVLAAALKDPRALQFADPRLEAMIGGSGRVRFAPPR